MLGEAEAEELVEDGGACAEQPRQIIRKTRNARRTIIRRNHLNMRKPLDYLMAGRVAQRSAAPKARFPGSNPSRLRNAEAPIWKTINSEQSSEAKS